MNKILWKYKKIVKGMKGELAVSELYDLMLDSIKKVKDGTLPTETATIQHLLAHRAIMDRYARVAEEKAGLEKDVVNTLRKI
ncbi:MAG: hypothetical protein ACTSX6_08175 [Candidatus Heimdallarchaeaceae archaeon]